ncbi:MAG: manganese efflux pump MntP family protein [Clostridia bacterium]|nr:manganese efflux pump MntP family protein [Clostridia bacterium]
MIGTAFFIKNFFLGVGLAMDAFSVSLANGLNEPKMKLSKMMIIAGVFAFFQAAMPLIGWLCVHTILNYFSILEIFIPWIAFILLGYIGGKMLWEGIKTKADSPESKTVGCKDLVFQGVATSIDALSVGFTIAEYDIFAAVLAALVIAAVTFVICLAGVFIGKKFGMKLSNKAQILGGLILIGIGIEILITGLIK